MLLMKREQDKKDPVISSHGHMPSTVHLPSIITNYLRSRCFFKGRSGKC
jgi:hypothetical protein